MRRLDIPSGPRVRIAAPETRVTVAAPPLTVIAPRPQVPQPDQSSSSPVPNPPPRPLRTEYALVTAGGDTTIWTVEPGHTMRLFQVQLSNGYTDDAVVKVRIGAKTIAAGYLLFFGGQLTKRWPDDDPAYLFAGDDLIVNLVSVKSIHVTFDFDLQRGQI